MELADAASEDQVQAPRQEEAKRSKTRWLVLALLMSVVLGLALNAPSLKSGLYADDYLQNAMLSGDYAAKRSAFDLYSFTKTAAERERLIRQGVLPWWSAPDLKLNALRPLASASLALDYRLGLTPPQRHAVSLAWLALLLAGVTVWYHQVLPGRAAALGSLLFAVDPSNVSPAGWLANRTALMCAVFGVLALIATCRFLERQSTWLGLAVAAAQGLALLSGEYALCAAALAGGFLLFSSAPRRARGFALLAWAAPTIAYLTVHAAAGYGAVGSSAYVNLASSPRTFAIALLLRFPALLGAELLQLPSEFLHGALMVDFVPSILLLASLLALLGGIAWWILRNSDPARRSVAKGLALGLVLALVPLGATIPSGRLLELPSVAGAGLIGLVIVEAVERWWGCRWLARSALAGVVLSSLLLHGAVAAYLTHKLASGIAEGNAKTRAAMLEAPIPASADTWLLVNSPELNLTAISWVRQSAGHPLPDSVRLLTSTRRPLVLRRTGPRTLRLSVLKGGAMLDEPGPFLFRSIESPLETGDVVHTDGLDVRVLEALPYGYRSLEFEFQRDLDDPSFVFLVPVPGGQLKRLTPPKTGRSVTLPPG